MKKVLLSAKLDYLLDYAKKQYSKRRGLHLNSKDWESFVDVRTAIFYSFLVNGTIKFRTTSRISKKTYNQYVKLVNFKKVEPALLLLFLIDTPEDQIINFLKTFLFRGEAKLFCEGDPSFLYWGSKYNLTQLKSCYGPGETRPPDIRDPQRNFLVCKHLWLVLVNFEKHLDEFARDLMPYYKRAFGLTSPTGLERLKRNLGDKGLKKVIEAAVKNISKLKSEKIKTLFRELTADKLNARIQEKLNKIDMTKSTETTQDSQDKRVAQEFTPKRENIPPVLEEESVEDSGSKEERVEDTKDNTEDQEEEIL